MGVKETPIADTADEDENEGEEDIGEDNGEDLSLIHI